MTSRFARYAFVVSTLHLTTWAGALPPPRSIELAAGTLALLPCLCCAARPRESLDQSSQVLHSEFQASSSQKGPFPDASDDDHHDWSHGVPEVDQEKIGFGLSVSLLATILWDMFLLYMLMNPDPQVKSYSLKAVNTCMIIFMALSIEHSLTAHDLFGMDLPRMAPMFFVMCWKTVCGLALYFRRFQGHPHNFAAAIALTSHILAFLGMSTFKRVIKQLRNVTSTFGLGKDQLAQACCLVFIGICFKVAIVLSVTIVEKLLPADDAEEATLPQEPMHQSTAGPQTDELGLQPQATESKTDSATYAASSSAAVTESHNSALSTKDVVEELEENLTDAFCLFLSYLVKNLILSSIFSYFGVPEKANPREKVYQYPDEYKSFILAFGCILVSVYVLLWILGHALHGYRATLLFLSFLTSWMSASFVRWTVCAFIQKPSCLLVISAVICSVFCCIGLVVVDKLADWRMMYENTAEELIVVFGFVIGCSWEKAFEQSTHDIIEFVDFERLDVKEDEGRLVLTAILVAIMLPGWRFLVLPSALKPTPPRDFKETLFSKARC